jgi:hypothetical protein
MSLEFRRDTAAADGQLQFKGTLLDLALNSRCHAAKATAVSG